MADLMYDDIQTVRSTTNAAVRTIRDWMDAITHLKDYTGYDSSDVFTALTNGFTDSSIIFMYSSATLATNYTIASGKTLVLMPGCTLTIASGVTLTCTGTCLRFVTGQIAGSGTASGSGKLLVTTTNA